MKTKLNTQRGNLLMQTAIALCIAGIMTVGGTYGFRYLDQQKTANAQLQVIHAQDGALQSFANGSISQDQALQAMGTPAKPTNVGLTN